MNLLAALSMISGFAGVVVKGQITLMLRKAAARSGREGGLSASWFRLLERVPLPRGSILIALFLISLAVQAVEYFSC